ncbi:hypothetical protein BC832DRAFT_106358 [Gaertneriomyces semiglobifer]|nr:hypothetical protein BC832DRAFT_106358 [Gaertneriomyces semiglobifer]
MMYLRNAWVLSLLVGSTIARSVDKRASSSSKEIVVDVNGHHLPVQAEGIRLLPRQETSPTASPPPAETTPATPPSTSTPRPTDPAPTSPTAPTTPTNNPDPVPTTTDRPTTTAAPTMITSASTGVENGVTVVRTVTREAKPTNTNDPNTPPVKDVAQQKAAGTLSKAALAGIIIASVGAVAAGVMIYLFRKTALKKSNRFRGRLGGGGSSSGSGTVGGGNDGDLDSVVSGSNPRPLVMGVSVNHGDKLNPAPGQMHDAYRPASGIFIPGRTHTVDTNHNTMTTVYDPAYQGYATYDYAYAEPHHPHPMGTPRPQQPHGTYVGQPQSQAHYYA